MKVTINSYQFDSKLNIDRIKSLFTEKPVKYDQSYLLYQLDKESFAYVKDFGCIVLINISIELEQALLKRLNHETRKWANSETHQVVVDAEKDIAVGFDYITIPSLDVELIHIIALNLAQSSILHHYQLKTDQLLEKTRELSGHLEKTGKVNLTRKRLAKYIGQIMSLQNKIADNLYIFESPPLAWTDIRLSKLDTMLSEELEFKNRYHGVQSSLNVIRENHEFFKDLLQHKHSSMLEWIIILLILFEIVQIFIEQFK